MKKKGGEIMTLQEEMIQFRARNNLSQKRFAELCNISIVTLNNVERGVQKPSTLTEAKIRMVIKGEGINEG
jgi:DNA-binding transcriptional regulator YiaG